MCDLGKALSRAFSPPGTGALINNMQGQQAAAQQSSDVASQAMQDAIDKARQASMPAIDNEDAYLASLAQQRRLIAAGGAASTFRNTPTAAPVTATKILLGA